jgi:hypothetical protein
MDNKRLTDIELQEPPFIDRMETPKPIDTDVLPACPYEEGHTKYFSYRKHEGELCKYYPYTGVYISLVTGQIVANIGGREDFDGSALATKRHADRRAAIAKGLAEAAQEEGIGSTPTDMLAQVVKAQAKQALEQTRDGTGAAKFVWGLVGVEEDKKAGAAATVTVELDADSVASILQKLAKDETDD